MKGFTASSIIKPRVLFCKATLHLFRHRPHNFSSRVKNFAVATNKAVLPWYTESIEAKRASAPHRFGTFHSAIHNGGFPMKIYRCTHCGIIVAFLKDAGVPLFC
ncbi:MAG TPA: hypothetical protein H9945_02920, partial [Candidatus Gemmiger avicola]|nr:hypothetical protein [Candidatus Gemmiger avicola]